MVLELAYAALSRALPSDYWLRLVFAVVGAVILRTLSQGRKTTRERNLNARVILVTVAWPELPSTFQTFTVKFVGPGWLHTARANSTSGVGETRSAYNRTVSGTNLVTTCGYNHRTPTLYHLQSEHFCRTM